ncbi:hypothetical protein BZG35_03840 [Brevundimonas sp. LM2]|nr:hypothetical protein BZG35_03840 [Brevundimonas sp. LM2]
MAGSTVAIALGKEVCVAIDMGKRHLKSRTIEFRIEERMRTGRIGPGVSQHMLQRRDVTTCPRRQG